MKAKITHIFAKAQLFSLEEATARLPLICRMTEKASRKVQSLIDQLDAIGGENEELVYEIEEQINQIIQMWQSKIEKLGALPKGLWVVDFDCGNGYYCWKYPEPEILFWHNYSEGFSKRSRICAVEMNELLLEEKTR